MNYKKMGSRGDAEARRRKRRRGTLRGFLVEASGGAHGRGARLFVLTGGRFPGPRDGRIFISLFRELWHGFQKVHVSGKHEKKYKL